MIGKAIFFAKKHFSSSLFKTIKIAVVQYYRSSSIYLDFYFEIVDFNLVLPYIYIIYTWFFGFCCFVEFLIFFFIILLILLFICVNGNMVEIFYRNKNLLQIFYITLLLEFLVTIYLSSFNSYPLELA